MTEHIHSRAKPTESELDKVRSRLAGHTNPNASGATVDPDVLPTSTASLAARLKPVELTPEQQATAQANIARRQEQRRAAIAAQRAEGDKNAKRVNPAVAAKAATDALPPDPVNGKVDEDEDDMEDFMVGMSAEEREAFKKVWAAQNDDDPNDPAASEMPPAATGKDALLD